MFCELGMLVGFAWLFEVLLPQGAQCMLLGLSFGLWSSLSLYDVDCFLCVNVYVFVVSLGHIFYMSMCSVYDFVSNWGHFP